jgi:hypothetical protein
MGFNSNAPPVAVLIHGSAADAADTVRGLKAVPAGLPFTPYLAVDAATPAEALNRLAAVRTEGLLLFLRGGVGPTLPNWLARLVAAVEPVAVGAAVMPAADDSLDGLLTKRAVFDLLGGFDADRCGRGGHLEDYLSRVIGLGYECVAPGGVEVRPVRPPLKRAG